MHWKASLVAVATLVPSSAAFFVFPEDVNVTALARAYGIDGTCFAALNSTIDCHPATVARSPQPRRYLLDCGQYHQALYLELPREHDELGVKGHKVVHDMVSHMHTFSVRTPCPQRKRKTKKMKEINSHHN